MKIIVSTCDAHAWMLPVFFHFYKKAWPSNPYQTEIITQKKYIDGTVFYTGRGSWSTGILNYLKGARGNKFMLILEDFLLRAVDAKRVKIAERLCTGDVGCVRLSNDPHKYFKKHTKGSPIIKGFRQYPNDQRFSGAIQIAIFQKRYLFDVLKDRENIWDAERKGTQRLKDLAPKWRILWPEENIFDYPAVGLMRKGILQPQALKWAKSELPKNSPEYKILQDQIEKQSDGL